MVGFAGAAALITGMTGMGFGISHPAQAAMAPPLATTTKVNQVPTSVTQVGEYGENIYEAAQTNNWTQASAKLTSLKDAAKRLDNESRINENPGVA